tara:strand:+ start:4662 stop:5018 length:357 start_codon:yes stop_codon:yes gene_type:complete
MIKAFRNRLENNILTGLKRSFWMFEEQWEKEIRKEREVYTQPIVIWHSPLTAAQDYYEEVQRMHRIFQDICMELNSSKSFDTPRKIRSIIEALKDDNNIEAEIKESLELLLLLNKEKK